MGYDAYIPKHDVTLHFRYHGKLLMANGESLVIAKRGKCNFTRSINSKNILDSNNESNVELCYATRKVINGKSKSSLTQDMEIERLINRMRRQQRRLGFQSDSHAEVGVSKFWKNVKSCPSDFRSATTIFGPDVA